MHETLITVTGNLVADPEMRTTSNGDQFVTFRLACTERRRDANGAWGDGHTNYVRVTAFRSLAANVAGTCRQGMRVVVQGRLRVTQWRSEERRGTSVEIDAHAVGVELTFAHAVVTRGVWCAVPDRLADVAHQEIREDDAAELEGGLRVDLATGEVRQDGYATGEGLGDARSDGGGLDGLGTGGLDADEIDTDDLAVGDLDEDDLDADDVDPDDPQDGHGDDDAVSYRERVYA